MEFLSRGLFSERFAPICYDPLNAINFGYCCKLGSHPDDYGPCYDEDVSIKFNQEGWASCLTPGNYITGVYRGHNRWLGDIDYFRCCSMTE